MNFTRQLSVQISVLLGAAILLSGCEPKVLPNSGNHPPLSPADVKLYAKQPSKYEDLGMISIPITKDMKFDDRGDSTAGFEALKAKAAALGANGVLLMDKYLNDKGNAVTAGYKGEFYQVPLGMNPPTAMAHAIWVVKE